MARASFVAALLAAAALLLPETGVAAPPVPVQEGFVDTPLVTGLDAPSAVRFPGDGRIFVAEKDGRVLVFDAPQDPTPTIAVDLREDVYNFWDRGLLGMALHPEFTMNPARRWIYLLYARDGDGVNPRREDDCPTPPGPSDAGCVVTGRLVRVAVDAFGVASGPPTPMIENEWCVQFPSHTVGTVAFGPDDQLYVSAGEGANYDRPDWGEYGDPAHGTPFNPCGDENAGEGAGADSEGGALRSQDAQTPGDPQTLDGTIIRVDPVTGDAAPGNPYEASGDPDRRRVIAYGMRNPFRFTVRPGHPELWVGDVGWNRWEEINRVDLDDDDVENLGWPCREGPDAVAGYAAARLCATPQNEAVNYTAPIFQYAHWDEVATGDLCVNPTESSSISGLAFHGSGGYPAEYDGALFFTDYARNCIWSVRVGPDGTAQADTVQLLSRGAPDQGPVDLQTDPEGNLVYAYYDWTAPGASEIRRIRYQGPSANVTAAQDPGNPRTFDFDATGSSSTSAGPLTYRWDLDGNGSFETVDDATVRHTYPAGRYVVRVSVRVTDAAQDTDTASITVGVGNRPPATPAITAVGDPHGWKVGDRIILDGSAADPDGDPVALSWRMTMIHGGHGHPIQTTEGARLSFVAPDHEWPSHLVATLVATDDLGATSQTELDLHPRTVRMSVRASPAAPVVVLNAAQAAPSIVQTMIAGSRARLSVSSPQQANGEEFVFQGWSDGQSGGSRTLTVTQDTSLVARFLSRPQAVSPPLIRGAFRTGRTLDGAPGGWLGNELTQTWQWLRCGTSGDACSAIPGATGPAFRLGAADRGRRVRVEVTSRNPLGVATARSAPTPVITDGTAPRLRFGSPARARLGDGRLRMRVACANEACRLRVRAVVLVGGRRAMARKVTGRLVAGRAKRFEVRLSPERRRAAADALRRGRRVTVRWTVAATDAAGNRAVASRIVRMRL